MIRTSKTGKPRQRIQWSEEMNTFIMCQYYIITKLERIKIGYRRELHYRFTRKYPELEISEQRIADQRRAIVTKGLLSKPWLEEITAQVAETFKEVNVNAEKETTEPTDENEQYEDSRRLEHPPTAENPELDKIKMEFYKALKEFEGTDSTIRYQIPKQKCSQKLATIITTINQEILLEHLKHNVTSFLEIHDTIYMAAVATARLSGARIDGKS